ncbi:metallophosphoesterase family protein [Devosia sediminis]|uniref:Serine/threonine protein phosphatase n=1 Tax=Devosia sediminis TaxID=2798801 RepID=A0A934MJI9_9HYPH|nr:metallophosphoesterase family protein [Devosia sediminis]MBJ3783120.1 serine/threonine protein phosphatase [Devosia sediminis]
MAADSWPAAIYAIGDVHGCLAQVRELERLIAEDAKSIPGEKWMVYLGDYIDRGPDSAGVLDKLLSTPPAGFRRICLVGNHEVMALAFLRNPQADADWLKFGGLEFLHSYQLSTAALVGGSARSRLAVIESHIPSEHISFLKSLPLSLTVPGYTFVHAGLRSGISLEQQRESDLLWIRDEFFEAAPQPGLTVVHGHTPAPEPVVAAGRICIDTGAFATGILTALRLIPGEAPLFLQTHNAR